MRSLAAWCHDRHRLVIGLWIGLVILAGAAAGGSGGGFVDNFSLKGSESQKAVDLLKEKFPQQAGDASQVVFKADTGTLKDPAKQQRIEQLLKQLRTLPSVASVADPFANGGQGTVSRDGTIAFATLNFDKQAAELDKEQVTKVVETAQDAAGDGLQVNLGGFAIKFASQAEQSATELVGVAVAVVVLVLVLGSLSAMAMPLIVAFAAIAVAMSLVFASSAVFDIASFAPSLAVMISLGVGIDYALLVINRFRGERTRGADIRAATITAMDSAGRTVLFAGTTVVIALMGMLLLSLSFLNGPAVASALAVALTMIGSLTLLPALLGSRMGRRVKLGTTVDAEDPRRPFGRWARVIQHHPRAFAVGTIVLLLVVASPTLGMNLGNSDSGSDAPDSTTRKAYDQLAEGFGPGFNGPLLVVAQPKTAGDTAALGTLAKAVAGTPGVIAVGPPAFNATKDTATLVAIPAGKPQDTSTTDLLNTLRDDVVPAVERDTGLQVSIGGSTATNADFSDAIAEKLPLFIAVVVGLSLLLLTVVFRSLVIPAKAAAMNLLSVGASLGVITFVFQEGHLASLIGVDSTGPIESFFPVFLFSIVFGLSMDYEVFLVSRMHEEWEKHGDATAAVRRGLALTGKVIMAAAIIMISVFASFMLGGDRTIKLFGLGLASAILFDAFVIRLALVPALMYLFGERSWWIPDALGRRLPRLSIEGPPEDDGAAASTTTAAPADYVSAGDR
jgi:RND superfamily putative drug exporter